MPDINVAMEVERVMNLVRGFGWEKTKEERVGGNIDITITKAVGFVEGAVENKASETPQGAASPS